MDLAQREELYKRCDPFEALTPEDPRYVDIDAAPGAVRGGSVVDSLAARREIASPRSPEPGCETTSDLNVAAPFAPIFQ